MQPSRNTNEVAELMMQFAAKCRPSAGGTSTVKALEHLLTRYDSEPAMVKDQIRQWRKTNPGAFWPAAFHVLRREDSGPCYAALARVVRSPDDLIEPLLEVDSFQRGDLIDLARLLQQMRPTLDVLLVRRLSETADGADPGYVNRVLRALYIIDILTETPERLPALLVGFRRLDDERVRSKITLLLARRSKTPAGLENCLRDSDPRRRANAVEGLWGSPPTAEVRRVFWDAVGDKHHRVVGNALVGLARIGDRKALDKLCEMAAHEDAGFRAAAAWAMGELKDARFSTSLVKMVKCEKGAVRQGALKALVKIRKAAG
ncbi:MAG: HEAT repeat domain-containing protein [bacterium]|nr:HEAT repeat domain-containing protein [bacterium]